MSMGDREFVEFLIEKIKNEGVIGAGYSDIDIVENGVIETIWEAYEEFKKRSK